MSLVLIIIYSILMIIGIYTTIKDLKEAIKELNKGVMKMKRIDKYSLEELVDMCIKEKCATQEEKNTLINFEVFCKKEIDEPQLGDVVVSTKCKHCKFDGEFPLTNPICTSCKNMFISKHDNFIAKEVKE